MARKNYTQEFRRRAVDLYRSTPGAIPRGIAADLSISRHTRQAAKYPFSTTRWTPAIGFPACSLMRAHAPATFGLRTAFVLTLVGTTGSNRPSP